jgi:hypothetical protein
VQVGTSDSIARSRRGFGDQTMRFGDFLADGGAPEDEEPPYLFDKNESFEKKTGVSALWATLERARPGAAGDAPFGALAAFLTPQDARVMLIGAPGSAVSFHNHPTAFNVLLSGRKRWWLYPPTELPPLSFPQYRPQRSYWASVDAALGKSAAAKFVCTQLPGETLYLPGGFYHATQSLTRTVGIARKAPYPTSALMQRWEFALDFQRGAMRDGGGLMSTRELRVVETLFARVRGVGPAVPEVSATLAHVQLRHHVLEGALDGASASLQAVLEAAPTHSESWHNLGVLMQWRGDLDGAERALSRATALNPHAALSFEQLAALEEQRALLADGRADAASAEQHRRNASWQLERMLGVADAHPACCFTAPRGRHDAEHHLRWQQSIANCVRRGTAVRAYIF